MQTLDGLLKGNYITMIQYLERIPNGIIPKKQELIEELQAQMQQQQIMAEQQAMMQEQQMVAEQEGQAQQEQQMQGEKEAQYEKMAQFMESLPPDVQDKLQMLPPEQMEVQLMQMMKQSVSQGMKNNIKGD
jgi:hypothetical protein